MGGSHLRRLTLGWYDILNKGHTLGKVTLGGGSGILGGETLHAG